MDHAVAGALFLATFVIGNSSHSQSPGRPPLARLFNFFLCLNTLHWHPDPPGVHFKLFFPEYLVRLPFPLSSCFFRSGLLFDRFACPRQFASFESGPHSRLFQLFLFPIAPTLFFTYGTAHLSPTLLLGLSCAILFSDLRFPFQFFSFVGMHSSSTSPT